MILVDTSVWIDHFHRLDVDLAGLLENWTVCTHPLVIAELAVGSLRDRASILRLLQDLPGTTRATDTEVLDLIESRALHGLGLPAVDVHLLAAALLTPQTEIWTRDRRLRQTAQHLGVLATLQ